MLEDLGSRHDLPRMVHKELKEPELAWAEFDLTPVTLHRVAGGIDHDARYLQHGGPLAGAPADQRTQPREEFAEREGLHQVIVGTGVETANAVLYTAARRKHQDRCPASALAKLGADVN